MKAKVRVIVKVRGCQDQLQAQLCRVKGERLVSICWKEAEEGVWVIGSGDDDDDDHIAELNFAASGQGRTGADSGAETGWLSLMWLFRGFNDTLPQVCTHRRERDDGGGGDCRGITKGVSTKMLLLPKLTNSSEFSVYLVIPLEEEDEVCLPKFPKRGFPWILNFVSFFLTPFSNDD